MMEKTLTESHIFEVEDNLKQVLALSDCPNDNSEIHLPFNVIFLDIQFTKEELESMGINILGDKIIGILAREGEMVYEKDGKTVNAGKDLNITIMTEMVGEVNKNLKLKVTKYNASNGKEYFLEIVNSDDILFGLCRLRVFDNKIGANARLVSTKSASPDFFEEKVINRKNFLNKINYSKSENKNYGEKQAIIRELHVYGPALKLGAEGLISQHRGFGKWLMEKAEEICRRQNIKKLKVISGIGVREYYKKLGYKLEETYMIKKL